MFINELLFPFRIQKNGKVIECLDYTSQLKTICQKNGDCNALFSQLVQIMILNIDCLSHSFSSLFSIYILKKTWSLLLKTLAPLVTWFAIFCRETLFCFVQYSKKWIRFFRCDMIPIYVHLIFEPSVLPFRISPRLSFQ